MAFIIDVFGRAIVSWQISTSLRSGLAIDELEMAIYSRNGPLSLSDKWDTNWRTWVQFFCSTCAPSFLLPERNLVKVI